MKREIKIKMKIKIKIKMKPHNSFSPHTKSPKSLNENSKGGIL